MKPVTEEMIKNFKIMKLGHDFMGYKVDRKNSLSFHHLIIPHRECKRYGIGEGYVYWNGAILVQATSHEYLHLIENYDYKLFGYLTSEMIDENVKGYLDITNLKRIREILLEFEHKNRNLRNKKGKILIKEEYKKGRIPL